MKIHATCETFEELLKHLCYDLTKYKIYNNTIFHTNSRSKVYYNKLILDIYKSKYGSHSPIFKVGGILYKVNFPDFHSYHSSPIVFEPL
jgi:hypothetical protein